jgi:hypothetical protein
MYKLIFDFLSVDERRLLLDIARELAYQPGRQETGYQKAFIDKDKRCSKIIDKALNELSGDKQYNLSYDAYILNYPVGSYIPPHQR